MTVAELTEIEPLADVYEIKPDVKYLIKVPQTTMTHLRGFAEELAKAMPNALLVMGDVRIFEIS